MEIENYWIEWISPKKQVFEMPTGGVSLMEKDENICYFKKKEQCLALATQLRKTFKISNYRIYRLTQAPYFDFGNFFQSIKYSEQIHPKDGVFPEKLNPSRIAVGNVAHSIGKNPQPVNIKFNLP